MPVAESVDELDRRFMLDAQVAIRREPFGALAYHFQTRRLVFLKTPELVEVVTALSSEITLREVLTDSGIEERNWAAYAKALEELEAAGILQPCEVPS